MLTGTQLQANALVTHVAEHLRSLALISLPFDVKGTDDQSQVVESHRANESTQGGNAAILNNISSLPSDADELASRSTSQTTLRFQDDQTDEVEHTDYAAEWGFLSTLDHLQYDGPDKDPVLQPFLRQRYLENQPPAFAAKGPSLPCFLLPLTRNENFFGRKYALAKAAEVLVPSLRASFPALDEHPKLMNPRTFVIYGPGGMGKTQVAMEFVHQHKDEFDAVLWAHADDVSKLAQDFNTMAIQLGLVAEDSPDARDQRYARELVKRWLVDPRKDLQDKQSEKASWLLIYDSVEDTKMLNEYWPYDGPGSILITSRNPHTWTSSLQLIPFSPEEAIEYLLHLTGRNWEAEDQTQVQDVSQKLGGLPLALTQMAGIISRKNMTFAQFAEAYNARESRHQMLTTAPVPAFRPPWYEHSVASVWALESLRHSQSLLNTCAMLDPDGIDEELYTASFGKANLPGLPTNPVEYQQAKAELLGSSIVSSEKASGKLIIHRLVQDVARMRMDATRFRETFLACVRLVSELWPFQPFDWRHGVQRWSKCEALFPHVLRLRDLAAAQDLFPSADDWEGDFAFAKLLVDAGWYHHERGRSAEARSFNNPADLICRTWYERPPPVGQPASVTQDRTRLLKATLAEVLHNRGCAVMETNQPRLAFRYFEDFNARMLAEFEESPELVKKDMRLAISWNELGNAHMLNNRWREGEDCFDRSMQKLQLLDAFEPSQLSLPLANISLSYWLQGRHREALRVLTQGLKDREAKFGVEDRISFITGRYLHALGNVTASLGDQEESLEYHRRALFHYKSTLGNGHHRTADLFVKMAEHYIRMRQEDNALYVR